MRSVSQGVRPQPRGVVAEKNPDASSVRWLYLQIADDRMRPALNAGQTAVFDRFAQPKQHDIVAVAVGKVDVVVGRYQKKSLTFDDPTFAPLALNSATRLLGVLHHRSELISRF